MTSKLNTLFITVVAGTVALNLIYEGLVYSDVFIDNDENVAF